MDLDDGSSNTADDSVKRQKYMPKLQEKNGILRKLCLIRKTFNSLLHLQLFKVNTAVY